ncbi:death-associated protein kinase 2-like isoform X3 [Passer montanus]|uniref:death-associated protein kinase 2-like isoform X3 n=1 Tax=Passer montanus TaxID=9160 RepID=UPI00195FDA26|nr:death-associated protein kinase 2-like isoform X3 [Passer montanus]
MQQSASVIHLGVSSRARGRRKARALRVLSRCGWMLAQLRECRGSEGDPGTARAAGAAGMAESSRGGLRGAPGSTQDVAEPREDEGSQVLAATPSPGSVEDTYELLERLGSGHFGEVRLCRERSTGAFYAAKFVKMRRGRGGRPGLERARVEREVSILRQLQHPNIIQLHELFSSTAEAVLVLELIRGGELFDFIAEKEMLSEEEAIEFLGQILRGVEYLHARLIAHFDLKPENIMLQEKDVPKPWIKIIDFGLAQQLEHGTTYKSLCGTPQYIAPEVINYEPLSPASDMWVRRMLRPSPTWWLVPTSLSSAASARPRTWPRTSSAGCWRRMSAAECLVHPWIKPLSRKQALSRSRSSINMRNFRKFNARRKWKLSYNTVSACNRLCRVRREDEELRCCESDQEEERSPHAALLRRRRSSCS